MLDWLVVWMSPKSVSFSTSCIYSLSNFRQEFDRSSLTYGFNMKLEGKNPFLGRAVSGTWNNDHVWIWILLGLFVVLIQVYVVNYLLFCILKIIKGCFLWLKWGSTMVELSFRETVNHNQLIIIRNWIHSRFIFSIGWIYTRSRFKNVINLFLLTSFHTLSVMVMCFVHDMLHQPCVTFGFGWWWPY